MAMPLVDGVRRDVTTQTARRSRVGGTL